MSHCRERWLITITLSLCLVCRVVAVYCTMVDVRLTVLGYAAHGSNSLESIVAMWREDTYGCGGIGGFIQRGRGE